MGALGEVSEGLIWSFGLAPLLTGKRHGFGSSDPPPGLLWHLASQMSRRCLSDASQMPSDARLPDASSSPLLPAGSQIASAQERKGKNPFDFFVP